MPEYSGRTTAYSHKQDDWEKHKGPFTPAITQQTIFNVQWTDCPVEVEDEVRRLWRWAELDNHGHYEWDSEDPELLWDSTTKTEAALKDMFPVISEYLESKNIKHCLIHWWW